MQQPNVRSVRAGAAESGPSDSMHSRHPSNAQSAGMRVNKAACGVRKANPPMSFKDRRARQWASGGRLLGDSNSGAPSASDLQIRQPLEARQTDPILGGQHVAPESSDGIELRALRQGPPSKREEECILGKPNESQRRSSIPVASSNQSSDARLQESESPIPL